MRCDICEILEVKHNPGHQTFGAATTVLKFRFAELLAQTPPLYWSFAANWCRLQRIKAQLRWWHKQRSDSHD